MDHDRELRFHLASADGRFTMNRFGPVPIRSSPEEHFRAFFQGIEGLAVDTPADRRETRRQLAAKGVDLFDRLFPDDLKVLLWDLQDRISTVQVLSEDPWIPWELCKLKGKVSGYVEEGPFFAERFCMTRWRSGTPARPRFALRDLALVVPGDSGLAKAQGERAFLLSLKGAGREVTEVPPTYMDVTDAMAKGRFDAWHFAGHASASPGRNADQAFIELRDMKKLTPEHLSGRTENVRVPRPFVFLNACQSGRAGLSLTGVGGWAERFLGKDEAGASVFIGTYWHVFDDAALKFCATLYKLLLAGQPVGMAVRDARAAIQQDDELSWLAYTVYADPSARVG